MKRWIHPASFVWALLAATASASNTAPPPGLRDVGIEQRLDQVVPLDLRFRDESDNPVRLGDFFGQKPVLLAFVYYHCPMLCPMALEGLVRSLRPLSWNVGEEFQIVTVSIDERESPAQAAEKKRKIVALYGRDRAASGWHFLVGEGDAGRRLAEAVGFRFRYDGADDQFAHATGLFVLTPLGRISRVLFGIDYAPRDVRLALVEASQQKIGTLADQLLLFCYHYDPATGKYGPAAMAGVRIGAVLTLAALAAFVVIQLRHESAQRKV
ncbi:MAG: SCO family protein [Candidatus Binatia bacterium]